METIDGHGVAVPPPPRVVALTHDERRGFRLPRCGAAIVMGGLSPRSLIPAQFQPFADTGQQQTEAHGQRAGQQAGDHPGGSRMAHRLLGPGEEQLLDQFRRERRDQGSKSPPNAATAKAAPTAAEKYLMYFMV